MKSVSHKVDFMVYERVIDKTNMMIGMDAQGQAEPICLSNPDRVMWMHVMTDLTNEFDIL